MPETIPDIGHNQIVYSVSEISSSIKNMVEDRFGRVCLRGEISGWKVASSGHVYFSLKDSSAVINAICWRGVAGKFNFKPEDGLEVVASGKVTTYAGRSSYQIIVDSMRPSGVGALMALLEKRKAELEKEGLFAPERKKKLPYLPQVIGVITSPTGAVIRDILHRISERFPLRVLVFPVAVQGEGAAEQITAAINFFNNLDHDSKIPKPDLLIVARGGGSIEDLWAFNEEIVVRAAANSSIPLISAVGHETDTTLIDYVSDRRAPTPTAAAEIAVPVRSELILGIKQLSLRGDSAISRLITQRSEKLNGMARGLPKPMQLLQAATQRLDDWSERLVSSLPTLLTIKQQKLTLMSAHLRPHILINDINNRQEKLVSLHKTLEFFTKRNLDTKKDKLFSIERALRPITLVNDIKKYNKQLNDLSDRLYSSTVRKLDYTARKLENSGSLLESVNYKKVLARGFALVKNDEGNLVMTAKEAKNSKKLQIVFADDSLSVSKV
ncbi:MAG: exodeoxyribonuclease VII large subunit [Rickettsiales bacterium]